MNKLSAMHSSMKNKLVDDGTDYCDHDISAKAESWGGYMRYWCEPCFCSVVPPVPWSEVIDQRVLYDMCSFEGGYRE